jgi:hypothetical protein
VPPPPPLTLVVEFEVFDKARFEEFLASHESAKDFYEFKDHNIYEFLTDLKTTDPYKFNEWRIVYRWVNSLLKKYSS